MAGFTLKTLLDGLGAQFQAWWYSDGTYVYPTTVLGDGAGNLINFSTASPVFSSGRTRVIAPASTTTQCGATGAIGDVLDGLLITPLTTSPGQVSIEDGSTVIIVFQGGASSVTNLVSFPAATFSAAAVGAGWKIICGANVQALAVGKFT
jgi:hypothetical protein